MPSCLSFLRRGGVSLVGLTALLIPTAGVNANPPGPTVTITQPASGYATNAEQLDVTVAFEASAAPAGSRPTGNVHPVQLTLEGETVGTYQPPPAQRAGTHTFEVDLTSVPEGALTLQAVAFQGEAQAGLLLILL